MRIKNKGKFIISSGMIAFNIAFSFYMASCNVLVAIPFVIFAALWTFALYRSIDFEG